MSERLAGILAILASLIALLISVPFSAAYFQAYDWSGTPPWMTEFVRANPGLFNFAERPRVYQNFGQLYSLVIPLTIPALLALKKQIGTDTRLALWGWRVFFGGLLVYGLGVFGDYWPNQNTFWVGIGFLFEMIGAVVFGVGAILYGIAAIKENRVSRWIGFGLVGIAPLGVIGLIVLEHIPAGPLLGYVMFWLVVGSLFLWRG